MHCSARFYLQFQALKQIHHREMKLREELASTRLSSELVTKDLAYSKIELEKAGVVRAELEKELVSLREKHAMTESYLRGSSIDLASAKDSLSRVQPGLDRAENELKAEKTRVQELSGEIVKVKLDLGAELAECKAQLLSSTNLQKQFESRAVAAEKALIRMESENRVKKERKELEEELSASLEALTASQMSVQSLTNQVASDHRLILSSCSLSLHSHFFFYEF